MGAISPKANSRADKLESSLSLDRQLPWDLWLRPECVRETPPRERSLLWLLRFPLNRLRWWLLPPSDSPKVLMLEAALVLVELDPVPVLVLLPRLLWLLLPPSRDLRLPELRDRDNRLLRLWSDCPEGSSGQTARKFWMLSRCFRDNPPPSRSRSLKLDDRRWLYLEGTAEAE